MNRYAANRVVQTDIFVGMKLRFFFYVWLSTMSYITATVDAVLFDNVGFAIMAAGFSCFWAFLAWLKLDRIEGAMNEIAEKLSS